MASRRCITNGVASRCPSDSAHVRGLSEWRDVLQVQCKFSKFYGQMKRTFFETLYLVTRFGDAGVSGELEVLNESRLVASSELAYWRDMLSSDFMNIPALFRRIAV